MPCSHFNDHKAYFFTGINIIIDEIKKPSLVTNEGFCFWKHKQNGYCLIDLLKSHIDMTKY